MKIAEINNVRWFPGNETDVQKDNVFFPYLEVSLMKWVIFFISVVPRISLVDISVGQGSGD